MPIQPFGRPGGDGGSGAGQQGKARQGLFGTLPVTILTHERRMRNNDPSNVYIDGRFNIVEEGPSYTFFQVNYKLAEFEQAHPMATIAQWFAHYQEKWGMPAFLLGEPRQREKDELDAEGKPTGKKDYSCSFKVVGWKTKEEFNPEKGDGTLNGIVLFEEVDGSNNRLGGFSNAKPAAGDKPAKGAFLRLHTYAVGAYMNKSDTLVGTLDRYVFQAYDEVAEAGIRLLSEPNVTQGTAFYVKATIKGGRLVLKHIEIAKNQQLPRSVDEAKLEYGQRDTPTMAPQAAFNPAAFAGAPQAGVPQFGAPPPAAAPAPRKSLGSFGAPPAPQAPWGNQPPPQQ